MQRVTPTPDDSRRGSVDDRGASLIEVIVAVLVVGLVLTAATAATSAVFGLSRNTQGRLDNAAAEQLLSSWLPSDLASAESFDTAPDASPCAPSCPSGLVLGGSNGLLLRWTSRGATTISRAVSYRYRATSSGYELVRVECGKPSGGATTCGVRRLVPTMPPPPLGSDFVAGVSEPTWAISVSAVDSPRTRQVVVTLDGGGTSATGDPGTTLEGGIKQVVFRGTPLNPKPVDPETFDDPWFTPIESRCSGRLGLIVDNSNSIGDDLDNVRNGVSAFVDAFAGTPVKIKIVTFAASSTVMMPSGTASQYWDMMDPQQVRRLKELIGQMSLQWGTNWEDAIFRMFQRPDGSELSEQPDRVVFFTDGAPYGHMALEHERAIFWSSTARLPYAMDDLAYAPKRVRDLNELDVEPIDDSGDEDDDVIAIDLNEIPRLQPAPSRPTSMRTLGLLRAVRKMNQYDENVSFVVVGVGPALERRQRLAYKGRGFHLDDRGRKVFRPPIRAYEKEVERPLGKVVLERLLTSSGNQVVRADYSNGRYTNAREANFYPVPRFSQLGQALKTVATGQCGGTVTLQTEWGDQPFANEVQYQNSLTSQIAVTSLPEPYANIDLATPEGELVTVVLQAVPTPALDGYTLDRWSCRRGGVPFTPRPVDAPGSAWDGIAIDIAANLTVSCTMHVRPV